jgi:hypothetical protein
VPDENINDQGRNNSARPERELTPIELRDLRNGFVHLTFRQRLPRPIIKQIQTLLEGARQGNRIVH